MVKNSIFVRSLLFIAALILLNIAAQYAWLRIDLTKEKRYTLSEQTKAVLKQARKPVTITVFLDGQMPAAFKRLKNATSDLLADYRRYANVPVNLIYIDPLKGLSAEAQDKAINDLAEIGIKPVAINLKSDAGITQKIIFPMALIEMDGQPMPVNLLQKSGGPAANYEENITYSIQNLEYAFTAALHHLQRGQVPRIGFTEGHGEPSNLQFYDAISSLSSRFYVGRVDLNLIRKTGLDSLQVLVIADPKTAFTEAEKYKINYFVMKGGKVIWLIDQVQAALSDLQDGQPRLSVNSQLNIDDMLFEYGARVNYNLVADANSALIPVSGGAPGQIELFPWLYFPVFMPDSSVQMVKNIDGIRTEFASTVDTIAVKNVEKKVVLRTSDYYKVYQSPKLLSLQLLQEQPDAKTWHQLPAITGVLLEGRFKSVFQNRPVPEGVTEPYPALANSVPTKMLVIGDGNVFSNQVSATDQSPFPLGFDRYSQLNYGNKALLLNVADYFTDDRPLIALRNKEIKERLLDKMKLKNEKTKWQLVNSLFPLFLLILLAIFQHYYRKYKYTK